MPTKTGHTTATWFVNQSGQTWTLTKNASITVTNGNGITEAGTSDNLIKVLGDIKVSGPAYGVYLNGGSTELFVGADSFINARMGTSSVYSGAAGAHIENHGRMEADGAAIGGAIWSDVENYGLLKGNDGINHAGMGSQIYNYGKIDAVNYGITEMAGGTHIENGKNAEIAGDVKGIFLQGSGTAEIINRGTLRGDIAIETQGDIQTVTNIGKIFGDVLLGAGNDYFDSRKGTVKGEVHGGDGDDDYYVGKAKINIVEENGGTSGYDEVYATVSHKLADNVEVLRMLGNKDLTGTGNAGSNWLRGNAGDNVLKGGGGTDYLYGNHGDDTLTGGLGAKDYFIFDGNGADRITDFEDGLDLVQIAGVDSQSAFDALNIKQLKGGDLLINFGNGDKIIIDDLLKSDFTYTGDVTI